MHAGPPDASGYYRPRSDVGGRALVLLAVLAAGVGGTAQQQRYRIFRPCSGPAVKALTREELTSKYAPLLPTHVAPGKPEHLL